MWPWEHAAVGYLAFSVVVHALYRRSPAGAGALVLGIATQFPDLVDKPLSWGLGLFPTGFAVAQSVFVAIPLALAGAAAAVRLQGGEVAAGLLVGYWSHLVADVFSPLRSGGHPAVGRVLWPVVESEPYGDDLGVARGLVYLREYVTDIASTGLTVGLTVSVGLFLVAIGVWAADGFPGVGWLLRRVAGNANG